MSYVQLPYSTLEIENEGEFELCPIYTALLAVELFTPNNGGNVGKDLREQPATSRGPAAIARSPVASQQESQQGYVRHSLSIPTPSTSISIISSSSTIPSSTLASLSHPILDVTQTPRSHRVPPVRNAYVPRRASQRARARLRGISGLTAAGPHASQCHVHPCATAKRSSLLSAATVVQRGARLGWIIKGTVRCEGNGKGSWIE